MTHSHNATELIKEFEGCRLTAYKDIVGVLTIGYGDTHNVIPGMIITQSEADSRLEKRIGEFDVQLQRIGLPTINQNEYDALVSFVYNLGSGALNTSTLLRKLRVGDKQGAADEFLKWNKAGGAVISGLTRRRNAERMLFLS